METKLVLDLDKALVEVLLVPVEEAEAEPVKVVAPPPTRTTWPLASAYRVKSLSLGCMVISWEP